MSDRNRRRPRGPGRPTLPAADEAPLRRAWPAPVLAGAVALALLGPGAPGGAAPASAQEPRDPVQAAERGPREPSAAQIERVGRGDVAVDRRLARLLESDPMVVVRDTMLSVGDTVARSVLVLDATLIHEGVITGDLVLVDAGAFVRPRAVVRGDLVNVGGGLYRSQQARVGGAILDLPLAGYRVVREPDRLVIQGPGAASPIELDEFVGFHAPTYDRVNGVTAVWGATYHLPPVGGVSSAVHGQAGWLTERGEPTWAADLTVGWGGTSVFGGYSDGWATNEEWIRGGLTNSIAYVWDGDDYRNYHAVERAWAGVAQAFGDEEKRFYGVLSVRGQVEDATSLAAGSPWSLWGDDSTRVNPAVDDGRISSVVAAFEMEWEGLQTVFEGGVAYEAARSWQDGDFTFDRVEVNGDLALHALANHTLEIELFGQLPVGNDALPRQRRSFIGGSGTLQTLDFAEFSGDRVVFVETSYVIPMPPRLALPVVGAPDLELVHAVGMAWTEAEERDLHQEIGARIQFFGAYVRYMLDPTGDRSADLDIGVSWPFDGSYPWQRR